MSEQPEIKIQGEDSNSQGWWVRFLPVVKSGRKLSIHQRRLVIWLAVGVFFVVIVQLVIDNKDAGLSAKSTFVTPDSLSQTTLQNIPAASLSEIQGLVNKQKSTNPNPIKISGMQVISRPRNLSAIPPGSMLEAKLVSGASNGLVRAEVSKSLYVNGDILIPEGAYLVGSGSSTEDRLFVRFTQVVFKDGEFGSINAEACDKTDKIVGLKGSKVGNKALQLTGSLGLGFLGGFSTALQDADGQNGAVVTRPSIKNALLNGTATTALEESRNMMSDLKSRIPIIEVPQGTTICIIASGGS